MFDFLRSSEAAMFLLCSCLISMLMVFVYLFCSATGNWDLNLYVDSQGKVKRGKGLSASELEKLPKVVGKDLVLGTDCAVCLDEISSQQPARMIPGCNHGFHVQCADSWLARNSVCPVCRAKISHDFFEDVTQANQC